mmetsp:Transcript_23168/g.54951  ORF Transcript_23168/g.54951 Transcript_23168/m.54951 type:complete len:578 (-) Transcript_23168:11-1744(-)
MTLILPKVSVTLQLVSLVVSSSSEAVSAAAAPARAAGVAAFFVPNGGGLRLKSSRNGRWRPSSRRLVTTKISVARIDPEGCNGVADLGDSTSTFQPLLRLASAHCASQALCAAIQLDIPNLLWDHEVNVNGINKTSRVDEKNTHAFFVPLHDIASSIGPSCHVDTLLRMMRLLTTIDIVEEIEIPTRDQEQGKESTILGSSSSSTTHTTVAFRLTRMGRSLMTTTTTKTSPSPPIESSSVIVSEEEAPSMASCFLHWMERPLWNSWLELSDFIRSPSNEVVPKNDDDEDKKAMPQATATPTTTSKTDQTAGTTTTIQFPFERANDGISSDYWYNKEDHPESLFHANQFVKLIHQMELQAVVDGYDWSSNCLDQHKQGQQNPTQRIVDIGGHHGQLLTAIASSTMAKAPDASVEWFSLDLPNVIDRAGPQSKPSPSSSVSPLVTLVKGDVFDTTTIPSNCDTIIMKHFLDRCMWSQDETIQILQSCHAALTTSSEAPTQSSPKRVIIAEAILPDYGQVTSQNNQLSLYLDGMYSIVGRERQRTLREWTNLATTTGFVVESVHHTNVPSCSILVLRIKD